MDDDTVTLAERATLGALLQQPGAIDQVRAWLRPGDFADWWHAQVYAALLARRTAGESMELGAVARAITERLGSRRGEPVRVLDLVHDAPAKPVPPVYARMVLEAGLRREIAGQGVLLRAGALQSMMAENAGPLASACLVVDAAVEAVSARWAAADGHPTPRSELPTPLRPAARPLELRSGADKFLRDRPPRDPGAERDHSVVLIGSLLAHPEAIADVASWLRPAQIPDPGWRAVYGTATELAARGDAVDAVTVAWAVAPLRGRVAGVPSPAELRKVVDDGWYDHPAHAARVVAGEQVCALADRVSAQLIAAAEDSTIQLEEVADTAGVFTNALRHAATGYSAGHVDAQQIHAPQQHRGPVAG